MSLGESGKGIRVGVMGGTFDPIHHGHLVAASEVQHQFGLHEVIFVPTSTQPFKQGERVSEPEQRYLMTCVATAEDPHFTVSRVDIDRGGITYTADTLRELRAQRPGVEFFFITGADAIRSITKWYAWEELFDLAQFVGVTRPGHSVTFTDFPEQIRSRIHLVEIPALAISSTDLRRRVRCGAPISYLTPQGVVRYIDKYGLYRD